MAATTTRGLHAPQRADAVEPNVTPGTELSTDKTDVALLADTLEARVVTCAPSVASLRGSAGTARRLHYATDSGDWSYDNGSVWLPSHSSARAIVAAGSSRSLVMSTPRTLPLGSITEESVADVFEVVAHDTSGHAVQVAFDGLYRLSVVVSATGDASSFSGNAGGGSFLPASGLAVASASMVSRVSAGGALFVQGFGTAGSTWTQTVQGLIVERVAP